MSARRLVAGTAILLIGVPAAASDPGDCLADTAIQELPPGCAVLAARAIWLGGDSPMDESFQLYRDHADDTDRWLGSDKVMHFGVSFMLTLTTQYVLVHRMDQSNDRAWPVAAGTALAFGLFKEFADSQRQHRPLFSWRDMAANLLGVGAALAVIHL